MTRKITEGTNESEKCKTVKSVCLLVVRKFIRARICTVQLILIAAVMTALNKIRTRFRMYSSIIRIDWVTSSVFNEESRFSTLLWVRKYNQNLKITFIYIAHLYQIKNNKAVSKLQLILPYIIFHFQL